MDDLELYKRANHYINEGLIRTSWPEEPQPRKRREWMEWFLPRLDHPQRVWEAIHVAGTSGKGSVAVMVAEILRAAGVRAGLHVSPYLQVSTEKLWVDGRYASAREYDDLVQWITPACEACRGPHVPLHGMASVGLCLEHFRRQGVELGVMETGVGGRSDLTNVLRTRVAVITSVGLDHIKTLGPELADIAWHKAGIIKAGCRAVVLHGPGAVAARRQAAEVGAPLRVLEPGEYSGSADENGTQRLTFRGRRYSLDGVPLAMAGAFQAENAALAVAAIEELGEQAHAISEQHVRQGLANARMPGRVERLAAGPLNLCPVVLDGAHNPDKLAALLSVLPDLPHRRLHVVYGSLGHRTPDEALTRLAGAATTLVLSQPNVYAKSPRPVAEIAAAVAGHGGAEVIQQPDPLAAVEQALDHAGPDDLVVVTGSLYLCGEIRGRWYPEQQVLERRQSWF